MRAFILCGLTIVAHAINAPLISAQDGSPRPLQQMSDVPEALRLERLRILACLWGKIELFHPQIAADALDWDAVLIQAIPRVEAARTTEQFVAALNESLFRPLGDPLSFARTAAQADALPPRDAGVAMAGSLLVSGIGYLDATDPFTYRDSLFQTQLARVVEGRMDALVVDLRWREKQVIGEGDWLELWADSTRTVGRRVSRLHQGFDSRWQVEPGRHFPRGGAERSSDRRSRPYGPDSLPVVRTPTVVLVNLTSYPVLEAELDALQARGGVAVVLERAGPLTESWTVLTYPEGVRVRLNSPMLLSHTGALGTRPDTILDQRISSTELPDLARGVLRLKASVPPSPRSAFAFPAWRRQDYEVSLGPLSREERLLGLFKLWNYIGTFNAYQEYASTDWTSLLPEWIPRVEMASDVREYYRAIQQITALLNDSHAGPSHPSINPLPWRPPVVFVPAGKDVVAAWVDTARVRNGEIERGDVLLAVDGRRVEDIESYWRTLCGSRIEPCITR